MTQRVLTAGDTYSENVSLAAYPAGAGWVLKERFTPRAAGMAIAIVSTASGDDHLLAAAAATTAAWVAGAYAWVRWVEKGAEVFTVSSGQLTVLPNLREAAAGTDSRTQAEKALADCKAAFAAWSPTRKRYKIGEREMEFNSTAEILKAINFWTTELAREQGTSAQGGRYYYRAQ